MEGPPRTHAARSEAHCTSDPHSGSAADESLPCWPGRATRIRRASPRRGHTSEGSPRPSGPLPLCPHSARCPCASGLGPGPHCKAWLVAEGLSLDQRCTHIDCYHSGVVCGLLRYYGICRYQALHEDRRCAAHDCVRPTLYVKFPGSPTRAVTLRHSRSTRKRGV